ncbi:MAG TPA: NAD-dependent epimerase/dehydratase family protein [Conexibacter sp.]|nr:NAD-dependent epimerase/dehydratase family protein [Conexibacter sp.]
MSRVLVTGGAGFIGSHVVDKLIAAGHDPVVFDVRRSSHHPDVETVLGDMCVLDDLLRAADGCDAIAHLAAAADVGEVQQDPLGSERLNARGTANVLEAARRLSVRRVVYASTIWVYSDVEADAVDETTALAPPAHLYTATKLAGELYCRSYRELYGVESTVLRFGIPYGPRARPAAVIPIFVRKALAGEALTLAGGGLQTRRFVYVEDLAEGVVAGLAPQAADRTYNLVGDEEVTIREIAERVRDEVGDVELVMTDGRPGDFRGAEVSGARARQELGWEACTPFAEGLRRYVTWHREAYSEEAPAVLRAGPASSGRAHARLPAVARAFSPARSAVALRRLPVRHIARDVALILVGAVCALLAALAGDALLDGTGDVSHYAREHLFWALVVLGVVAVTTSRAVGAWRRAAERA